MNDFAHDSKPALLYVDDEPQALKYFARMFEDEFRILTAATVAEARELLRTAGDEVGVLVSDQRMPGETGVSLLEYVRTRHPAILRILTTAYTDLRSAIDAVNAGGAYQYVEKPWDFDAFRITLRRAVEHFELRREKDRLLAQKATAVQASLAADRTRTLAAVASILATEFRGALNAARRYLRDARRAESAAFSPRAIDEVDLWSDTRRDGPFLAAALGRAAAGLLDLRSTESTDSLASCLRAAAADANAAFGRSGVTVTTDDAEIPDVAVERPRRLRRLLQELVARLTEADGEELTVRIAATRCDGVTEIAVVAEGRTWSDELAAALYSLALMRRGGLMGHDMDTFPAYVLAADLGGWLQAPGPAETPASFVVRLGAAPEDDEDALEALCAEAAEALDSLALPSAD